MSPPIHLLVFLTMAFVAEYAHAVQPQTSVASQGETLIVGTAGKLNVQVKIKVREVQIGKPSDRRPAVIQSSCTYSRYPCSIVDRIEISVNGNPLFIPRAAFCDLADLNRAEIKEGEKGSVLLMLYGGDASESYVVKIEFGASQMKRRILSSAMVPDQPRQITTYHAVVLGD